VATELLAGEKVTWAEIKGELSETWDFWIRGQNLASYYERAQVWLLLQIWFHQVTGKNFVLIGCQDAVQRLYDRRKVWAGIFLDAGVKFHSKYLREGSNYLRPMLVQRVLKKAGVNLSIRTCIILSERHSRM